MKPPARMESREPCSIRLTPAQIELLREGARVRGIGWTTFARELLIVGMKHVAVEELLKQDTRISA